MSDEKKPVADKKHSHNIDISLNVTEILNLLIVQHFWATLISIFVGTAIYMCVNYNINIIDSLIALNVLSFLDISHLIILVLVILIVVILLLFNKKVEQLNNIIDINNTSNEAIEDKLQGFKDEVIKFKNDFEQMQHRCNSTDSSLKSLTELVYENIVDTRKIITILKGINSAIKKIPDKETILNLTSIRTKLISVSIIETISEYFTDYSCMQLLLNKSTKTVTENLKSKTDFIIMKLRHKMDEIKAQYVLDIFQLSVNVIDENIKDDIFNILDSSFNEIINYFINKVDKINTFDQIIYKIDTLIKQLSIDLQELYSNNIYSDSIIEFDNKLIIDDN